MTLNNWPEDKMQELLHCYNVKHMSTDECARHFGVTRGVITGKIVRGRAKYDFEQRTKKANQHKIKNRRFYDMRGKLPDEKNMKITVVGPNGLTQSVRNVKFKELVTEEPSDQWLRIWELKGNSCVWPVAGSGVDTMFCGDEKERGSYCAFHADKAAR